MPSRISLCVVSAEAEPWPDSTLEKPTPHMPTYKQSRGYCITMVVHSWARHAQAALVKEQHSKGCMHDKEGTAEHVRACTEDIVSLPDSRQCQ